MSTETIAAPAKASKSKPATEDFLAQVDIKYIKYSSTNEMFRDDEDLTGPGIKELADSISQKGLLQPILLRADGSGGFILVAGERRLRACKSLGMEKVPAYVKIMSEDDAFELQLTENLQREDVHPMKEARAFKYLQEKKGWSTTELALRFGKSETYILQRLKLTELLPEIAKDFMAGDMTLAQALIIARLQKEDQKEIIQSCKNENGHLSSKRNYYYSAQELEEFIADNITRELANAPFDINDATIVPKAGACSTCPKRSGAQSQLFADIKEKDRCFDSACFAAKKNAGVFAKVKELVEKKPDTIFLEWGGYNVEKTDQRILSFLSSQKIKPLKYGEDFQKDNYRDSFKKKVAGFVINDDFAGHTHWVYVKGAEVKKPAKAGSSPEKSNEMSAAEKKEAIARIRERAKRAAELDQHKIYERIIEALSKDETIASPKTNGTKSEWGLMGLILFNELDFQLKDKFSKAFGITSKTNDMAEANRMMALTAQEMMWMVRNIAVKKYSGEYCHDKAEGILVALMAKDWQLPVDEFRREQQDIAIARDERTRARIAELTKSDKSAKKTKKKNGGGEIPIELATSVLDS